MNAGTRMADTEQELAPQTSESALVSTDSLYIQASTSDNTRLAYQSDIRDFLQKGGALPATAQIVEAYLRACANQCNPRTLVRRLTALRQWHKFTENEDPTKHPLVTKTMQGILRLHGKPKKQAVAFRLEHIDTLAKYLLEQKTIFSFRDRALLLVGFFGAFRRSELVSLNWEQIQFAQEGVIINLTRSKTDQMGEGAQCVIPFGNKERCPVRALIEWREASNQWQGPVFRRISKTGRLLNEKITPHYWNILLKNLTKAAGLPINLAVSSHSLRRGFATEAARLGASLPAIQRHGRWRTTKTVVEYIEAGRQFTDSAAKVLFDY